MMSDEPATEPTLARVLRAVDATGPQSVGISLSLRQILDETRARTVAIDDDPTGSQLVHDILVVLSTDRAVLESAMGDRQLFVLTNSRSFDRATAVELSKRVAEAALRGTGAGERLMLISRGDSTLRGHVHAEVDALRVTRERLTGSTPAAVLFVPAFPEAGRVTVDAVHYVRSGAAFQPVGSTEFARDAAFGFSSSSLPEFLVETSEGRLHEGGVLTVGLDELRASGGEAVRGAIHEANGRWVVPDAATPGDLDLIALGTLRALGDGLETLVRSGPSLVRPLMGIEGSRLFRRTERMKASQRRGLIVVGSHSEMTNRQLAELQREHDLPVVELSVPDVLGGRGPQATSRALADLEAAMTGSTAILMTSRERVVGADATENLGIARAISSAVARVVRATVEKEEPSWVIIKGGITSHDVTVHGLGVTRARVLGQLFPGQVSVFGASPDERLFRGEFVIFPGNVGGDDALRDAVRIFNGDLQR